MSTARRRSDRRCSCPFAQMGMLLLIVVFNAAFIVSADDPSRTGCNQLPPIFKWACELREDVVENILNVGTALKREVQLSQQEQAIFGLGLSTEFRGGYFDQRDSVLRRKIETETNVSKSESSAVLYVERSNMNANSRSNSTVFRDEPNGVIDYSKSPYSFSLYQENDGSQEDPDHIPTRYLKMQGYKRDIAKKALKATLDWREANDIDTILARPNPKFDVCKRVFPHYFCGRDDTNHVILLQRPGLIDLQLGVANNLSGDDLLNHYVYEMEYLWQILEPFPNGTMTSIIDLTGLNFSVLTKRELVSVVQKFCSTMDAHFPQRSHKTLLINSPKWFGAMYKLISPLLRESTKQKISILSKGKVQDLALKELLSECPIDSQKSVDDIPPSQMEQDLRDFVLARLEESNVQMQPVLS